MYDVYDIAHVAGWEPDKNLHDLGYAFPGMDLYRTGRAHLITTAGEELDDLQHTDQIDRDVCEVWNLLAFLLGAGLFASRVNDRTSARCLGTGGYGDGGGVIS